MANSHTEWNELGEVLDSISTLKEKLRKIDELGRLSQKLVEQVPSAAKEATVATKEVAKNDVFHPSGSGIKRETRITNASITN